MKTGIKIIFTAIISAALLCGCNNTAKNPTSSDESSNTVSYISTNESSIQQSTDNSIVTESTSTEPSESKVSETTSEPTSEPVSETTSEPTPESSITESSYEISVVSTPESSVTSTETSSYVPPEYNFKDKYFVNKLDERMLKNFTYAYSAVSNFQRSVTFEKTITSDELDTIMFLLNYDCPELIQISGDYFPVYSNFEEGTVSGVGFSYIMDKKQYKKASSKLDNLFEKIKKNTNGKTELEKEKYVYDYIFNNCIYNETDTMSGSAYGALINHKGRCEAICKSFMWCMRELGIECMSVSGDQNWNTESLYASHSWNIVKINGEYYHLDITVDKVQLENGEKYPANYGFFNVNDSFVSKGRKINNIFTSLGVPQCTAVKDNYHILNGLYIDATNNNVKDEFYSVLGEKFSSGSDSISIKFKYPSAFEKICNNCDNWIKDCLNNISGQPFDYIYYTDDFSNTITISVKIKE
ncbi:MAG: transglutaminase domain-containing protein [Clostridia bacterium]|nr:transglutaminase domain-containing protein [Clostridia bacterium]